MARCTRSCARRTIVGCQLRCVANSCVPLCVGAFFGLLRRNHVLLLDVELFLCLLVLEVELFLSLRQLPLCVPDRLVPPYYSSACGRMTA